jgi:hypothetical protein
MDISEAILTVLELRVKVSVARFRYRSNEICRSCWYGCSRVSFRRSMGAQLQPFTQNQNNTDPYRTPKRETKRNRPVPFLITNVELMLLRTASHRYDQQRPIVSSDAVMHGALNMCDLALQITSSGFTKPVRANILSFIRERHQNYPITFCLRPDWVGASRFIHSRLDLV